MRRYRSTKGYRWPFRRCCFGFCTERAAFRSDHCSWHKPLRHREAENRSWEHGYRHGLKERCLHHTGPEVTLGEVVQELHDVLGPVAAGVGGEQ